MRLGPDPAAGDHLREQLHRLVWPVAAYVVSATVFCCLLGAEAWKAFGIPSMFPPYEDLLGELSALDCHRRGFDVFAENPCDPLGRVHVYSSLWLLLPRIGADDTFVLGTLLVVAAAAACVAIAAPVNFGETVLTLLFLLSPAVMLGFERANLDLLVLLLLAAGVWLSSRPSAVSRWLGAVPVWLAAALKIYPLAAPVVLGLYHRKQRRHAVYWAAVTACAALWLLGAYGEIVQTLPAIRRPTHRYGFGGAQLLLEGGLALAPAARLLLVATMFLGIVAGAVILGRIWPPGVVARRGRLSETFFLLGWAILSFCFVVISNFDYRNIFAVFLLPLLFAMLRPDAGRTSRRLSTATLALLLATLWNEFFVQALAGGKALGLGHVLLLVEHGLSWLLFVPLTAIAVELLLGALPPSESDRAAEAPGDATAADSV